MSLSTIADITKRLLLTNRLQRKSQEISEGYQAADY